jgi:CRP/FNR family cyclic AMP-dependent transcriptional regulator
LPFPVVLDELGAGDLVGEMGVLDGEARSATVVAIETTVALELSAATLAATVLRHPEATTELLRLLSRRLRSTDELAVQLVRGQLRREWVPT